MHGRWRRTAKGGARWTAEGTRAVNRGVDGGEEDGGGAKMGSAVQWIGLDWIGREGGAGFTAERRMVGPEGGAGGRRRTHAERVGRGTGWHARQ
jgi:hypothetical protein